MESSASTAVSPPTTRPPRPPTPPRETLHDVNLSVKGLLRRTPSDPCTSLHTPPNAHSPRSAGATNPSSSRLRKKVEWSSHTDYKEPPDYREGFRLHKSSPLSAPSSASSKPVKSILKPSPSPNPLASALGSQFDGLATQVNITEMLDSTIKQLAGSDRDSRLDAYMMLSRALKASNNLPDRVALQDKMSLFMQFIQRDITSKNQNGSSDASLINHALGLLITFLHFQAIASTLTSDFGLFIMDHSIRCFEDPSTPKELVRHLMQVVAFQTFSAKVMTMERVGRLVASLHKIENHVTGKSIVMGRIQVYKRLIKQSRTHMAVHNDWLKDMFTDMLSSVKDIRGQAISLGTDAGFVLRNEKPLMRKVTEIFQTADEKQTYIEYYMERLEEMIKDKQNSSAVPQIWSVVILFLRCPLDRWQFFAPWLKLAQTAFNTTDGQTKQEANFAWNRYVYLSLMDSKALPKTLGLLVQPLISQLRRKFSAKQVEEGRKLRKILIGGICNLYYYAFRPTHDKALTDTAWDLTIQPVMTQLINLEGKPDVYGDSMLQACRLLAGLFDVSTPRGWRDDRIRDTSLLTPEELPALDPKWTRRNSDKVFQVISPILETKFMDLANDESMLSRLWQNLVRSVAAACAKDIKVSEDTAKFIASSLGLLFKVWSKGFTEAQTPAKFYSSIQNFTRILVDALGLLPFTEKKLALSVTNTFEPVSTPSRPDRVDNSLGAVRAPVYHLFSMLCCIPPGGADDEALSDFIQYTFDPFFNDKSLKARVELAREMLRLIPRNTLSPYGPWILAAQNLRLPLTTAQSLSSTNPSSSDRLLGPEYREVVSLLERGLVSHPNLPSQQWFALFDLLSDHVVQECGDAGRALGIIEPLAKIILENFFSPSPNLTSTVISVTATLFKIANLPRDRQAVEVARRRLWGAPPTVSRASSIDPFDNLYKLGTQILTVLYEQQSALDDIALASTCTESISAFLMASFKQTGVKTLLKLHEGLSPWIQDEKAQLKLGDQSPASNTLRSLWDAICGQLVALGHLDKGSFTQIEPLLTAGFKSKHRYFVNKTAETWNTIVKDEEELECSDSLKAIVTSLRPKVDLVLPGIEESSGEFGAQAPSFIESQDDLSFIALSSAKSSRQDLEQALPAPVSLSKVAAKGPMTRKRRRDATPEAVPGKTPKRTNTPRLRHDNSQIQFAPIESSPLAEHSQHLTERQKEVRQRQKDNAGLYTNIRSSPRTRSQAILEEKSKNSPTPSNVRRLQATPERATSYEDFITSTPTPRRGQALHLADDNDPPSSPPEPRRYPLLSEIQTRSKSRNSMENWEFSSPPGTPATDHQHTRHDADLPHITLTNDSTQNKVTDSTEAEVDDMEIIPSSVAAEHDIEMVDPETKLEDESSELSAVPSDPPATPPPRDISAFADLQETPKSGEDEFVDARSSPERPSPDDALVVAQEAPSPTKDTSFYLSEGDESSMMRFVVELESRRCNLPFDKVDSVSPEKKAKGPTQECIEVSSPSEKTKKDAKRSASPVIPSTPLEGIADVSRSQSPTQNESQDQSQSQTKRKRKRSIRYSETRRKRRRSVDPSVTKQADESQPPVPENKPTEAPSARRSSRRVAGLREKNKQAVESQGSPVKKPTPPLVKDTPSKPAEGRDGGDTDEELMSQLVTESFAASQSQAQHEDGTNEECDVDNSMELVRTAEEAAGADMDTKGGDDHSEEEESGASKVGGLVEMLRGGLDELRGAALSREEVYQLEDILMDMKRELFAAERRGRS